MPGFVEEAGLFVGGGEDPEAALGGGEHGDEGDDEVFGDAGGFVDDDEVGAGDADDVIGDVGEADDAGEVGEDEGVLVDAVRGEGDGEVAEEGFGFAKPFGGLGEGAAGGEDEAVGVVEGEVDGLEGGDGGFAPLAGAAEEEPGGGGVEDGFLGGVRREGTLRACPIRGGGNCAGGSGRISPQCSRIDVKEPIGAEFVPGNGAHFRIPSGSLSQCFQRLAGSFRVRSVGLRRRQLLRIVHDPGLFRRMGTVFEEWRVGGGRIRRSGRGPFREQRGMWGVWKNRRRGGGLG